MTGGNISVEQAYISSAAALVFGTLCWRPGARGCSDEAAYGSGPASGVADEPA